MQKNPFQFYKVFIACGALVFLASCAMFTDKETAGTFPIYGNYCGPDHPKAGTHPTPIDRTDAACMHHDDCYGTNGYFDKTCDANLIAELRVLKPQSETEKAAQKLIILYFSEALKL